MTFRAVSTPSPKPSTPNTWDGVVAAARAAGAKFPQVVAAQWALESGYGKHTSGTNNYFGIKGTDGEGSLVSTTEFVSGMEIKTDAWFKNFPSLDACVSELVTKWYKDYKGYKGVNRASTPEECAELLVKEGYCTDPQYVTKIKRILNENS
jgi:flagellum-specific peptidoglycan hydrolase FlgJ